MVNVNVQLPPIVAASFSHVTEGLQHENQLQLAIPKTEKIHSYAKMREQYEREQVAHQSKQILQNDFFAPTQEKAVLSFNQRRDFFFVAKLKLSHEEVEQLSVDLEGISDYKQVMLVIEEKYYNAVSPIPAATISYDV